MFSWSKKNDPKKGRKKRRDGPGGPALNEFGIPISAGGENDEELEAELTALTGGVMTTEEDLELNDEGSDVEAEFLKLVGGGKGKKKSKKSEKRKRKKSDNFSDVSLAVNTGDLNEEDVVEDEDLDVDEDDPDLLEELMDITGMDDDVEDEESSEEEESEKKEVTILSMLTERLNMYKTAEANAKQNKESSRARRFGRGIKTLQQLIKKAEAGQPVLPSEIPPVIATNLKPAPAPPPPPPPASEPDVTNEEAETVPQEETDVTEKVADDVPTDSMRDLTIRAEEPADGGEAPSESQSSRDEPSRVSDEAPQPPEKEDSPLMKLLRTRRDEYKTQALNAKKEGDLETALKHVKCVKQLNELIAMVELGEEVSEEDIPPSLSRSSTTKLKESVTPLKFEVPDEAETSEEYEFPTTVLEALNQRLRIYKTLQAKSEKEGDDLGARKNSKIVQVYVEAIKLHTAGKKVPLEKLPTPPGCPPIPIPFEIDD